MPKTLSAHGGLLTPRGGLAAAQAGEDLDPHLSSMQTAVSFLVPAASVGAIMGTKGAVCAGGLGLLEMSKELSVAFTGRLELCLRVF